jgi:hypothetical protein
MRKVDNSFIAKVTIKVRESKTFRLEVTVLIRLDYMEHKAPMQDSNYTPFPVIYHDTLYWSKVVEASRLDAYKGD